MSEDKFKIKVVLKEIEKQIIEYRKAHLGEAPEHVILNLDIYIMLQSSRELYEKGIFRLSYTNEYGNCDEVYGLKIATIKQKENIIKVC